MASMVKQETPVMILAGGLGTRLKEETEFKPKPMVEIGGRPILWHIMKLYSYYGFYRFIICLGYKGNMIKDYFLNYRQQGIDFTIHTQTGKLVEHQVNQENWEVTLVDTGQETMTGGRIARAAKYVETSKFMLTYGDGLADVDIQKLIDFHDQQKKLVTLTAVKMHPRFGNLVLNNHLVKEFQEKQALSDQWINGGFFVVEKEFLPFISSNASCIFEKDCLPKAAKMNELSAFKHQGFWHCMDTIRDNEYLEQLYRQGAPWKVWEAERQQHYFNYQKGQHEASL